MNYEDATDKDRENSQFQPNKTKVRSIIKICFV